MKTKKIRIKLRGRTRAQMAVHRSRSRFNVVCFGRQSGKTTTAIDRASYKPLMGRKGGLYWFIEPTFTVAQSAFHRHWELLKRSPHLLACKPHESDLRITLINGAQVLYKSGEVFENLRMETLDGCIIDEVRQQRKELWSRVIRPMLARRMGWCDFYSTANGFDHFYDLHQKGLNDTTGEWASFHAPSSEAPWWTQEELDSARSEMSAEEYAQEIEAQFMNIHTGKAYSSEGPWNRLISSPFCAPGTLVSKYLPITIGLDFNVNPMSWHLGQFRGRDCYWFDEIHIKNTNTQETSKELVSRLLSLKEQGLLTNSHPQVILCGDSTGESRNTKATKSDYDLICEALDAAKITWHNATPSSNPPVKVRVNTMNARLRAADGSVSFFYHPGKCPYLGKDFDRVAWKEGAESLLDQVKDKSLTHASDGVGYSVCVYAPIELSGSVGRLHVIPPRG